MNETIITLRLPKKQHDIVRKVAKKLKISKSEVVRRRIPTYEELYQELVEDLKHSKYLNIKRYIKEK